MMLKALEYALETAFWLRLHPADVKSRILTEEE